MFGLQIQSTSGHINLDSRLFNLCEIERRIKPKPASENRQIGKFYYKFNEVVRTKNPPYLFIRFEHYNRTLLTNLIMIGNPYAWEGFVCTLSAEGKNSVEYVWFFDDLLSYIIADVPNTESDFGLSVYGESGEIQYTSGEKMLELRGQTDGFKSAGRVQHNVLRYVVPRPSNSFFLVQGTGSVQNHSSWGVSLDVGFSNQTDSDFWMYVTTHTAGSPWYDYHPFLVVYTQ